MWSELVSTLDWPRWVERARQEAKSDPGRARVGRWVDEASLATDESHANLLQDETVEGMELLSKESLWNCLRDLPEIREDLDRLHKGAVLEVVALARVFKWLRAFEVWHSFPASALGTLKVVRWRKDQATVASPVRELRLLQKILGPDEGSTGEISENASPRLSEIIRGIRHARADVERQLDVLMRDFDRQGVLQEKFYDVHEGRFVVPIKIADQGKVEGSVFGASVSRQTVFIEPKGIQGHNNRLRQLENEKLQEIYLILLSASKELAPSHDALQISTEVLSRWDAIRARSRMAVLTTGKPIRVGGAGDTVWTLRQTVHPLLFSACGSGLDDAGLTRNSMHLESPRSALLLSGPNTGGKTVFLKTVAVASLCARSGFFLPGSEPHQAPFVRHVCVDAGDPQSIESHISSFSGRVLKIKAIFETLRNREHGEKALVLLDELGSATDPEEGSAFARAVLEALMSEPDVTLVMTTHDPSVKAFALSHSGVLTGGLQFDESSGKPTYKIQTGVMGRSRALETAERLGIDAALIQRARSLLSDTHTQMEEGLSQLERDVAGAQAARKEAEKLKREAELLKETWENKARQSVQETLGSVRLRLRRMTEEVQDEIRQWVKKMSMVRSADDVRQVREQMQESLSKADDSMRQAFHEEGSEWGAFADEASAVASVGPAVSAPEVEKLKEGVRVALSKWKVDGVIEGLSENGKKIRVRVGQRLIDAHPADIKVISGAPPLAKAAKKVRAKIEEVGAIDSKIDLRGQRFEDAMTLLAQYLDQAYRAGRIEVEIVHGLGTGALREGAVAMLRKLPYVETVQDGGAGRGGAGCTVVRFFRDV